MTITLDNKAFLGEPYSSGEYRTRGFYGYGCYEARFKPIKRAGVVTSFFTFAGPYDNGGNGRHNEIDIEFVGKDTTTVQFNFWTNDDTYSHAQRIRPSAVARRGRRHPTTTASTGRRRASTGSSTATLVYSAESKSVNPTPKAAESLHKIMMNAWPVDCDGGGLGWHVRLSGYAAAGEVRVGALRRDARLRVLVRHGPHHLIDSCRVTAWCSCSWTPRSRKAFSAPMRGGYSACRAYFTWPRISPTR